MIFSKSYCPYCRGVKKLLAESYPGVTPYVVELDGREDMGRIQDALQRLYGTRTVPQVFVKTHRIGGEAGTCAHLPPLPSPKAQYRVSLPPHYEQMAPGQVAQYHLTFPPHYEQTVSFQMTSGRTTRVRRHHGGARERQVAAVPGRERWSVLATSSNACEPSRGLMVSACPIIKRIGTLVSQVIRHPFTRRALYISLMVSAGHIMKRI